MLKNFTIKNIVCLINWGGCPKEQYDTKTYYLETAREIWQEYNDGI